MSISQDELNQVWEAALADAGIDLADAVLFALPGEASNSGYRAKPWLRGSLIDDPDDTTALGERLTEVNSEAIRRLRRVAVWMDDRSQEGLAATLRHELEHTIQLGALGAGLQRRHERAESMLIQHAGGKPGSAVLYQAIPMEADANAAASCFVRALFGHTRIDELVEAGDPDVAAMRRVHARPSLNDLRERMRHFIRESGPELAREIHRSQMRGGPSEHGYRAEARCGSPPAGGRRCSVRSRSRSRPDL